jgi:hypothetical protein
METAPLKNFATWARTALIREVAARVAAVLAPGSSERVEQAKAVAALERAVAAAGGGGKGRAAVADKVAYIWFNRIVALRFMDANGYTGIGIVSPQAGVEVGQPEILAEAKRGVIDTEVASQATRTSVAGLLDGTLASRDPQGEAFALLLADYCRYWNRVMPFMFEREGDYTELLIPANLLSDDSVLNRSVKVLTADVCRDVEVIGWLYQFYISERKDEVFAGFRKNQKAGADEIPAATQLFTPHWIVRYLVENALGRLWMLNRPSSGLASQMDYYIPPVEEEPDFLKIAKPEELKVIDPACGSGHMLTYAFDVLYAIYEEEGYGPAEIPGLILKHNLYGTEIDPRAGALAAFALMMKARAKQRTFFSKQVEPNICVIDPISFSRTELDFIVTTGGDRHEEEAFWNQFAEADTFGSLVWPDHDVTARLARHVDGLDDGGDLLKADVIAWARRVIAQAEYLLSRYAVVIANPPYMGGKNMAPTLSAFAKQRFPDAKSDLFAMFIQRNRGLVVPRGYVAMITMQSWMFLSSFVDLRKKTLKDSAVCTVAHLGTGAFESIAGAVVSTCAFVIEASADRSTPGIFIKLDDVPNEAAKNQRLRHAAAHPDDAARFTLSASQVAQIPGWTMSYWMSPVLLDAFGGGRRLVEVADPRQGMATADNGRFLRLWTEVSARRLGLDLPDRPTAKATGRRWFPYNKGGSFRRWYGNQEYVVNWEDDGRELMAERPKSVIRSPQYYFQESASWSKVGTAEPAFRYFPPGFLFDVAGTSVFADGHSTLLCVLAFGNSVVAREMLRASSTSMNLEVGTIAELPIRVRSSAEIEACATKLIDLYRSDWDLEERSWGFQKPPFVGGPEGRVERAIDHAVTEGENITRVAREIEEDVNRRFLEEYDLEELLAPAIPVESVALNANYLSRYGGTDPESARASAVTTAVLDLVSYAVGCMFGRYSLDEPGLILADQGATLKDYLTKIPTPSFTPDADNVIPIVDGDWFEDDIVERFRQFLRAAFGQQHFEENLRFVTESLGVKNLRDYFVKYFYKDHVQRYKKRPIYWLFSSSKGSFNALVYMHRYTPSTVSTVLNEYLREFQAKLKANLEHAERSNNAKEADRLRKVLLELDEYEHDILYPLASQNVTIDLDDGVRANYPKFGAALKRIAGLEAGE